MAGEKQSFGQRLKTNDNGVLYVVFGVFTAVLSPLILPLGLVTVFCGVNLYQKEDRLIAGGLLAVAGAITVGVWFSLMLGV